MIKKFLALALGLSLALPITSCSSKASTEQIRATLFLLDASKSTISSVAAREMQLKQRLEGVFDVQEAVYFDFIRNDFTKQLITPLISMQSIININDAVLKDAKDERVRRETKDLIGSIWEQSLSDSKGVEDCSSSVASRLQRESVLSETGSRSIARNLCVSAAKAKQTLEEIRDIGSGQTIDNGFIGSDVEGAFIRGLSRLESESSNLINQDNQRVGVRATIVVSSDMMQRSASGGRVIDEIRNMNEEQISEYVLKRRGSQEFRTLRPLVIIDGWLSTKQNFSESERDLLEAYWKSWFVTMDLDEPDFGFGLVDWSVTQ